MKVRHRGGWRRLGIVGLTDRRCAFPAIQTTKYASRNSTSTTADVRTRGPPSACVPAAAGIGRTRREGWRGDGVDRIEIELRKQEREHSTDVVNWRHGDKRHLDYGRDGGSLSEVWSWWVGEIFFCLNIYLCWECDGMALSGWRRPGLYLVSWIQQRSVISPCRWEYKEKMNCRRQDKHMYQKENRRK